MKLVRIAILFFACLTTLAVTCHAQSLSTASKGAEVSVFGGYAPGEPDYGPHTLKGFSAGGDFTLFPRFFLKPSFEARGNMLDGTESTEKSVLVGPRVQLDPRRYPHLHPYGDFLIGGGEILYHPAPLVGYTGDRARIYSFGGGLDIDLPHHFSARFDFQQQSWNFGQNGYLKPDGGNYTLAPRTVMLGIKYTVPFRFLKRATDYR